MIQTIDLLQLHVEQQRRLLLELAQACEIADYPNELDHQLTAVFLAFDPPTEFFRDGFSSSIDTARLLIPAGHWWGVTQTAAPDSPMRHFGVTGNGIFLAQVGDWRVPQPHTARNDHPALALCAAALKALAAQLASRCPQPDTETPMAP